MALPILTGNLRQKGFKVTQIDLDLAFYYAVDDCDKRFWVDPNIENDWLDKSIVDGLILKYNAFFEQYIDRIIQSGTSIVGFSVQIKSKHISLWLAEQLKKRKKELFVIMGGPEVHNGIETYLKPYRFIDAICLGEGDISFPKFLLNFDFKNSRSQPVSGIAFRSADGDIVDGGHITELPTSDDIPFADFSDMDFSKYLVPETIPMMMSRGCINRCSFCNESPLYKKYRCFSADRVYHEIRYHLLTTNVKKPTWCCFQDSLINGDLEQLEHFADLLIRKPIPVLTYSGMMLVRNKMSNQLIEKLAKSGLVEVFWGIESGSDCTLKIMRKNYQSEDAERILKKMHECGIRNTVFIIVGHPGESEEEYYNSLRFVRKIAPYTSAISVNIAQIFENSDLYKNPEKYGIVNATGDWTSDNGSITSNIRKHRQLTMRALIGNKASGMNGHIDPLDEESIHFYSRMFVSLDLI